MQTKNIFASRIKCIRAQSITKVLKEATRTDVISLAGGHPAEEMLPVETIKLLNECVFEKHGCGILQYGLSQGYPPLRQTMIGYLKKRGIICGLEEIGISSGAQNAIDAAAKLFINKGDAVAIEASTFFYSIQTLGLYEPRIISIESDENGMVPLDFEKKCKIHHIKILYIIPNFQNPTGRTLPLERRKKIVEIAKKYNVYIIEDDPYYELRYRNNNIPTLRSLAFDRVIYIGSFSKIFSPAMRLGYYVANKKICDYMTSIRQVDDIHANQYAQALACEFIDQGYIDRCVPKMRDLYKIRLDAMLSALDNFIDKGKYHWSKPEGGLFIWLQGEKSFDATRFYYEAIKKGVAFFPGKFFFPHFSQGKNCLRLNFTNEVPELLTSAIKILAEVSQN